MPPFIIFLFLSPCTDARHVKGVRAKAYSLSISAVTSLAVSRSVWPFTQQYGRIMVTLQEMFI